MPQPIEFFIASDASAIVEHTKRVLYLEDDDVAHIAEGEFHIHRLRKDDGVSTVRAIETLEIELAAIMKGSFDHFMQKEIYEQPGASARVCLSIGLPVQNPSSTPCAVASTLTRTMSTWAA
jgi:glucosamine 6-phosphate synthetase-like amidotransferase/phosphosugar isomerase protein